MNEKDLMNAMNEIDDDLLVFEGKKRKPIKGSWKMLIATALVMVFSVTAYAIGTITTSYKTKVVSLILISQTHFNYYNDILNIKFCSI